MKESKNILKNKMSVITCNHCNKKITSPELVGLTLTCPHCKKSVNGQYLQLQQQLDKDLKQSDKDLKKSDRELKKIKKNKFS